MNQFIGGESREVAEPYQLNIADVYGMLRSYLPVDALIGSDFQWDEENRSKFNEFFKDVNEHAVVDPSNSPDNVIARVTSGFQSLDPYNPKPPSTLNQVVARYGLKLHRFREAGLAPFDEIALLKSAVVAGIARDTNRGEKMAIGAMRLLRHESGNFLHDSEGVLLGSELNNIDKLARAIFALNALNEINRLLTDEADLPTNVDEALSRWQENLLGATEEVQPLIDVSEFSEDEESKVVFRPLLRIEESERIKGLKVIGGTIADVLGNDVSVRYFETVVFGQKDETLQAESEVENESQESDVESDGSNYLTSDYVIAEITEQLPDGGKIIHVVAESPHYGNACYVLRGDVLATVNSTLGEELSWQKVFGYPKVTARQLGARDFRHTQAANVPERVVNYLSVDLPTALKQVAKKWFEGPKPLYDTNTQRTFYNRLPISLAERIYPRIAEIRDVMERWLHHGSEVVPEETAASAGKTAIFGAAGSEASVGRVGKSELVTELQGRNESLALENERLRNQILELEEKIRNIRRIAE